MCLPILLERSAKFIRIRVKIISNVIFKLLLIILNLAPWIIPIAVGPDGFEFTTAGCLADDISLSFKNSKIMLDATYTYDKKQHISWL
jgi:hypothetical protein